MHFVSIGLSLVALSGLPGLFLKKYPPLGQRIALLALISGGAIGSVGAIAAISRYQSSRILLDIPTFAGLLHFGLDPLSSLFLLAIFIISSCSAVFALAYWNAKDNPDTEPQLTFFIGLLTASLAVVIIARDAISFLAGWEIMALSCFFAMTVQHDRDEVRQAGTLYLIATHVGTLALFAMFSLLKSNTGSYDFPTTGALAGPSSLANAIFVTAFIAFGLKAGMMPLHIWLPSAHAAAPSHVSALMSGLLIKIGIYGLIRVLSFFQEPPLSWGLVLVLAGTISAVLGVIFALGQHDVKRLLAYHSIENIGIIILGIGVAQIGLALGQPFLFTLGMAGAILHVLNHGIFKSLLFLGAGGIIHSTGTRNIDSLGGLAHRMPWTSLFFLIGAVAICGLPPLNGFISEFYIYKGLFLGILHSSGTATAFLAIAIPALALVGGLAVACFVKIFGTAFLGVPRSLEAGGTHESPTSMLAPMALLATLCIAIGLFPMAAVSLIKPALAQWGISGGEEITEAVAPLSAINLSLLFAISALTFIFLRRSNKLDGKSNTWDCGYLALSPRMQYTSSSFAEMFVKLFRAILKPGTEKPRIEGPFPKETVFHSHVPETVLELLVLPSLHRADDWFSQLRRLQHGQLHLYILYIFVVVLGLLVWALWP